VRALVVDAVRAPAPVREVAAPTAPPGGVVVRVMATGMCRSDWHAWAGHDDIVFPHVPGHELAGVVVEVTAGFGRWQIGDRVTVPFVCGCGRCASCRAGEAQVCPHQQQPGFTHWGSSPSTSPCTLPTPTWSPSRARRLPGAAGLGCRFGHGVPRPGRPRAGHRGEWVTVVGAGGVGLSAVMIARATGCRVVAVDRNPEALAAAARLGAEHTLRADGTDIPVAVRDLTGGAATSPSTPSERGDLRRRDPRPPSPGTPRAGRAAATGRRAPARPDGGG
jgi:alcohol dehydrogenase